MHFASAYAAEDGATAKIYTVTITRAASTGGDDSGGVVTATIPGADGTVQANYTTFGDTVTLALPAAKTTEIMYLIKLPTGILTLEQVATASVAEQVFGSNLKLELKQVATSGLTETRKEVVKSDDVAVDINIYSGIKKVTTFDGALTIQMPYNGPQACGHMVFE